MTETRRTGFGRNQPAFLNALTGTAHGVAQGMVDAVQLPGNILMGNTDFDPRLGFSGQSPQTLDAASNLAGMVTLGAGAMPSEAGALNMGMRAFHGSPHDFDKFTLAKIGTGEGAQAQGHGLYFAENPFVADRYRKVLSGPNPEAPTKVPPELKTLLQEQGFLGFDYPGQAVSAMRNHPDWESRWDVDPVAVPDIRSAFDAYEASRYAGRGKVYEVDIDADPEAFLNWDTPLAQQKREIQDSVLAAHYGDDPAAISMIKASTAINRPGSEWVRDMGAKHGPSGASAKLLERGVPGISYLDGSSREAGAGTSNHVVFDDNLINIMRKYGIFPGAVGAAAAGLAKTGGEKTSPAPNAPVRMGA